MISPTKLGIRNDSAGLGGYGENRGSRIHLGTDFLCERFQLIFAPFDMFIRRISNPKVGSDLSGIAWKSDKMTGKMFYFSPDKFFIGSQVKEGIAIGLAQSVSLDYGDKNMKDHIHFQIDTNSSKGFPTLDYWELLETYRKLISL